MWSLLFMMTICYLAISNGHAVDTNIEDNRMSEIPVQEEKRAECRFDYEYCQELCERPLKIPKGLNLYSTASMPAANPSQSTSKRLLPPSKMPKNQMESGVEEKVQEQTIFSRPSGGVRAVFDEKARRSSDHFFDQVLGGGVRRMRLMPSLNMRDVLKYIDLDDMQTYVVKTETE